MMQLTMSKDEIYQLMQLAHKRDMTLNAYIEYALTEYLQKLGLGINLEK